MENYTIYKGHNHLLINKEDDRSRREDYRWTLPPKGWCKANFDRAVKGNPGQAGIGGIIRNDHGKGIAAITVPLGMQTNHFSEVFAAHQTNKLAKEIGVRNLWLEGDSKNIINYLNEKNLPTWTIANIINESILYLKTFDRVYVADEYREANQVADRLANWLSRRTR